MHYNLTQTCLQIPGKKLIARALMNYSVVSLAALVLNQLSTFGTNKFSFFTIFAGLLLTMSWFTLAFMIEPEKEEKDDE